MYLAGGTGHDRITQAVVAGTYLIENVPAGGRRTLRLRVVVDDRGAIDRTGSWRLRVSTESGAGSAGGARAFVRSVTPAFARAAGVRLRLPATSVLGVAFHESPFGRAAALRPIGRLIRNANPAFDPRATRSDPATS